MKKLIILTTILCLVTVASSYAQKGSSFFGLSWEVASPSNNPYLSKTSWAGGRIEYRHMIKREISLGLAMSWNSFDEYVGQKTYTGSGTGSAVTTDMIRQIYTLPLTATIHYYPNAVVKRKVRPFVGLGLGGQYSEQNSYFNIYQISNNNWGFVMRPEIGANFMIASELSILGTLHYQYATNKTPNLNMNSLSQFGFNLGLGWKL
jgi:outer membrane protein W